MDPSILRDRLREIVGQRTIKSADPPQPALPGRPAPPALEALGGQWREEGSARSLVITRRTEPDTVHGASQVSEFAEALRAPESAGLLGAISARLPLVFFDLETTGLNGGAGTHAFLVGCGWFDAAGAFVTEQHLLTEFAGERSMLNAVSSDLGRAGALITFNGKSFDAPLLETRYLFHRLESPCVGRPHLDLLHPARRFWGNADSGCTLSVLEHEVLRTRRIGDVPGFEAPARYFHFVRTGDARPLAGVLEHNRLDLLSLAGLTARLCRLVDRGPSDARHAREALALGVVYRRGSLHDKADAAFERAIVLSSNAPSDADVRAEAIRALAIGARRQRRHDSAAGWWLTLLDDPGCSDQMAREAVQALAIHHEHRARDLSAAREFALRGLAFEARAAWGDAVRHRLARIERKMVSERPLFPSSTSPLSSGSPTSGPRISS